MQRDYYKAIEVVLQRTQEHVGDDLNVDEKWIEENRMSDTNITSKEGYNTYSIYEV